MCYNTYIVKHHTARRQKESVRMTYQRINKGVCSRSTTVTIEDGIVKEVEIMGGCDGNLKGVTALIKGMSVRDAIEKLSGITCGLRSTSCPDQLAITLQEAIATDTKIQAGS